MAAAVAHEPRTVSPAIDLDNLEYPTFESLAAMAQEDVEITKRSTLIDEELKKESAKRKEARRREVKVMLLGQAESGKSTLQKQFQLYYASKTLDGERPSWRPVVYFNIIKAVRMILSELDWEFANPTPGQDANHTSKEVQEKIGALRVKLLPLIAIESSLASELSGGVSVSGGRTGAYVRAGWQALVTPTHTWPSTDARSTARVSEVVELASRTISTVLSEIQALWDHRAVRHLLDLRKVRLDESAPFFLDNVERIAEPDYLPTTDDILNVRLQTLGIMEHSFPINMGGITYNWKLYDVGGARGQRHAWVPYFDDATAIIFLAPVSAFDQYLEEDAKTNRIDDSLQLWTAICSNKLLQEAHLVLLLNKADLLKKKLKAGIRIRKYITSYGERPNTFESASEYFRSHFLQIHRRKDLSRRPLYVHFTSMLDVQAMRSIIANVGEAIIRKHITETGLV
ncbi:guanine nucleotide binding protein, alpha subunit [Crucibulum laeve]|uniref:Guanine nucleotide binding protein, alpha subunit n=1 Tax=Crucibulum laeve TaxID=68775 RepID=A0A5C3MRZ3_9AGAR|nr:guanine nucleotide binding protein, alpha subunit [Crucibulum laeve]